MGLDPNDDTYEEGDECALCVNVLFDGVTPKYIYARISGIVQCPGFPDVPDDQIVLLEQIPACGWFGTVGIWSIGWELNVGSTDCAIQSAGKWAFNATENVECLDVLENDNPACGDPVTAGTGGMVKIFWGPDIPPPC